MTKPSKQVTNTKTDNNDNKNGTLIAIKGLRTEFLHGGGKVLVAVDGIGLDIAPGEIHAPVGESGCGKTITSLSILRLVSRPGRVSAGAVIWCGKDLL